MASRFLATSVSEQKTESQLSVHVYLCSYLIPCLVHCGLVLKMWRRDQDARLSKRFLIMFVKGVCFDSCCELFLLFPRSVLSFCLYSSALVA